MGETTGMARYVVFRIGEAFYALEENCVVEMHALKELLPHPHGTALVRGVARVRGRLTPVIDVRHRMGLPAVDRDSNALIADLRDREREHIEWVSKLKASINEGVPFGGATNPHACAFGRWFDSYRAPNDRLASLVARFDAPHQRIHRAAIDAQLRIAEGDTIGALRIAERAGSRDFPIMASLFERVRTSLREALREIVVYVEVDGVWRGLVVDGVEAVTTLVEGAHDEFEERGSVVLAMAKMSGTENGVFILDLRSLLRGRPVSNSSGMGEACSIGI